MGVGKAIIAIASLKPGIARLLSILYSLKESITSSLEAKQHILKHLTVNIVVQLLAAIQSPEEFFFLLFIRRESEFIRFPHQFFCPSTERFSVSRAMPPIVATKYEFVHKESKRRCNCGNSCRRYLVQHTT